MSLRRSIAAGSLEHALGNLKRKSQRNKEIRRKTKTEIRTKRTREGKWMKIKTEKILKPTKLIKNWHRNYSHLQCWNEVGSEVVYYNLLYKIIYKFVITTNLSYSIIINIKYTGLSTKDIKTSWNSLNMLFPIGWIKYSAIGI